MEFPCHSRCGEETKRVGEEYFRINGKRFWLSIYDNTLSSHPSDTTLQSHIGAMNGGKWITEALGNSSLHETNISLQK